MANIRAFKSGVSFLEKISMGATGTIAVFNNLRKQGHTPESLARRWIAFEVDQTYLGASAFRFLNKIDENKVKILTENLRSGRGSETITIPQVTQLRIMEERE